MKTSKFLLNPGLFVLIMMSLTACFDREDPGPLQEEERNYTAADFNRIEMGDAFTVKVEQGTVFSVKAKGDRRNLDDLEVNTNGSTLRLKYNDSRNHKHTTYVTITMPLLEGVSFAGAVTAEITGFESEGQFDVNLSGASDLHVSGKISVLDATISGASGLHAFGLETETAIIDASGASTAKVLVTKQLNAKASGASDIIYRGDPRVARSASGASTIEAE
jgi:hypothetical protein